MTILCNLNRLALAICCALSFTSMAAMADDTDLFLGTSGGTAVAPRVMLMVDNTQVSDQNFPNKMAAIKNALIALAGEGTPIEVGLALFNPSTATKSGAYIRFAPRDITVPANLTALENIVVGAITEANKDEPEMFYEISQYFSGADPWAGNPGTNNNSPSLIPVADTPTNSNTLTAKGQGLTNGFAYAWNGTKWTYNNPSSSCSRNFIIYITTDNTFTASQVKGSQCYNTGANQVCAGPEIGATGSGAGYWDDEWAQKLYTSSSPIVTYVIDAAIGGGGGADATFTKVVQGMAKAGGGKYSGQITSATAFTNILLSYLHEIMAANSTFASVSLPVNTTNRAQDKNQVFIPMFRPDPDAKPRWMGNLKKYQLINVGGYIELGDSLGASALNPLTGLPTDCATSFWTTDSGKGTSPNPATNVPGYWSNVVEIPTPKGKCATTTLDPYSDAPDGFSVEKGGVAEVIRKGNAPSTTNVTPTWAVNRTIYTQSLAGGTLTTFNTANSGLTASVVNFSLGQDTNAEYSGRTAPSSLTRPSLHGDSVHSRPQPIDYGSRVVAYYGSNDGMYRAVDAANGQELWAFIAPEHYSKLQRLSDNSPLVNYPSVYPSAPTAASTNKDYFFDGSTGIYQNVGNSKVWIYPTMRRGGRMIYALDVTSPTTPVFKWKVGCPNLANDTGCTPGMTGIGQTWSTPQVVGKILGYSGPVVIVGGGYDGCEDVNSATPACPSPKGAGVYVLDAFTGAVLQSFPTTRSVAADIALVSVATAGVVDHAYASDTGGNIYRIDFDAGSAGSWRMNRVAYTNGSGRKFFYPPALLSVGGGTVYLAIGSGDREHPLQTQYPYFGVTNRFYVYADNLAATTANDLDGAQIMNNGTDAGCGSVSLIGSTKKGWFMDLNQGEQTVTSAVIAAGLVTFSTNRPIPAAAGSCSTTLGEARGYWVNLFNGSGAVGVPGACGGTRSATFVGGGLPPSPVFGIVPVGGVPTPVVIGAIQRAGGASSSIAPQKVTPIINPKRKAIYWKSSGEN